MNFRNFALIEVYNRNQNKKALMQNFFNEAESAELMNVKTTTSNKQEEEFLDKLLKFSTDNSGFWCTIYLNETKAKLTFWGKIEDKTFKEAKSKDGKEVKPSYMFKVTGKKSEDFTNIKFELDTEIISSIQMEDKREGEYHVRINMNGKKITFT